MSVTDSYRIFVLEQLSQHFEITSKSMFGGVGIYADGYYCALIADDTLYLKVDDSNRVDFEEVGMGPFRPYGDERAMSYYEVPIDILEDPDVLKTWTQKAVEVAQHAKKGKRKKKP